MGGSRESGSAGTTAAALAITFVCLVPFLGKAVHVDDPLFLWNADQILVEPLDFFGARVNWLGRESPMAVATQNPPLTSYYLAAVIGVFGRTELAVHGAFLVFPLLVVLGTLRLARELGADPAVAALATALSPGFLVASTTVMSDVMMLSCWVWTVLLWIRGLRDGRAGLLFGAGLLAAAGALTKYFAISLVPLLAAFTLASRARRETIPRTWPLALALPVVALALYEFLTWTFYGAPHLSAAMTYSGLARAQLGFSLAQSGVVGLAFAGGCLAPAFFAAPLLWPAAWLLRATVCTLLGAGALALAPGLVGLASSAGGGRPFAEVAQLALFTAAGVSVVALALLDWRRQRDPESLLIGLWLLGTFVFAAFLNWSNNARSILPMTPALGLLLARRLAQREGMLAPTRAAEAVAAAASAALALAVASADRALADSARAAAIQIGERYAAEQGALWFQGHWGFQYYLEPRGGTPIDVERSRLAPGDVVVVPSNNANLHELPGDRLRPLGTLELTGAQWLATMSPAVGAGFYSSGWGPLPFAFGRVPPERFRIYRVEQRIAFPLDGPLPFGLGGSPPDH